MIVFPVAATLVAAVFSFATWRAARGGDAALRVWAFALLQFAVGSGALSWGIAFGWTPVVYRVFYAFGAVLNVAWLGLGTLWLVWYRPAAVAVTVALAAVSAWAVAVVFGAGFVAGAETVLGAEQLPAARDIVPLSVRNLSRWFSITGSVVVLIGFLSSLTALKRKSLGLGLLALGVVIAGVASELARAGFIAAFSVGLAVGITTMYAGFVRTRD